jgi:hypothetical protein
MDSVPSEALTILINVDPDDVGVWEEFLPGLNRVPFKNPNFE